jgi:hypothetical protein
MANIINIVNDFYGQYGSYYGIYGWPSLFSSYLYHPYGWFMVDIVHIINFMVDIDHFPVVMVEFMVDYTL